MGYNGTVVPGVQWILERTTTNNLVDITRCTDSKGYDQSIVYSPFSDSVRILVTCRNLGQANFQWDGSWFGHPGNVLIDDYAGTTVLRKMIDEGYTANEIIQKFASDRLVF